MYFQVLGPVVVQADDGTRLRLISEKRRAFLGVLLFASGRVVSSSELSAALWGVRPPASASANLRTYASSLRGLLERAQPGRGGSLKHVEGGYLLATRLEELDRDVFERLVRTGRRALDAGDPETAAKRLEEALRMWRGRPLGDLHLPALDVEVSCLESQRLSALEDFAAARLAMGGDAGLISELAGLTLEFPLRERLWCLFMLALFRSGQRAESLAAYGEARAHLMSMLGVEPGPGLRGVHQAVLEGEWPLSAGPPPTFTVPGRPV